MSDATKPLSWRQRLEFVRELTRWDEWATSKMPLIFASTYHAILLLPTRKEGLLVQMIELWLVLCLYAMFGYMINAWSDRTVDLAAGKRNALAKLSPALSLVLVNGVLLTCIGSTLGFYSDRSLLLLLFGLAFSLAAAYSMPPLRFKERGLIGMLASSIAQRVLPIAIVFVNFGTWDATATALCILSGFIGMRYILVHQISDVKNDLVAGVQTVATTRGTSFLRELQFRFLFPLEILTLFVTLILISLYTPAISAIILILACWNVVQYKTLKMERPCRFSPISYGIFADLYNLFLPMLLVLQLATKYPSLWPIAVFNSIWLFNEFKREFNTFKRVCSKRHDQ